VSGALRWGVAVLLSGLHAFDLHVPDEPREPQAQECEGRRFAYLPGIVSEADDGPEVPVHEVRTGTEVGLLHSHYCHQTPCSRAYDSGHTKSYVRSIRARLRSLYDAYSRKHRAYH
jgi:hypothetical protein